MNMPMILAITAWAAVAQAEPAAGVGGRDEKARSTAWSSYRFAPDAIQEIHLESEKAWTLSIDGGPERPIKVPAGGWNSDQQQPRIDTWADVRDHVIYRTTLAIPAAAAGKCVKLLLGAVNYGAEIMIDGAKIGKHVGCMTPIALDLSRFVTPGHTHVLQVKAFYRKHYGTPVCTVPVGFDVPAGCGIEGEGQTKFGYGINGYARLAVYPPVHIEDRRRLRPSLVPEQDALLRRMDRQPIAKARAGRAERVRFTMEHR